MLVLSRKPGESLIIGENADIIVTVISIRRNQVQIGIEAHDSVPVHREEIYKRLKAEKKVPSFAGENGPS